MRKYHINQYTVVLPITNTSFTIGALSLGDIISIKTSINLTYSHSILNVLKSIYNNISIKPFNVDFSSFESFISNTSYYDIDILAYITTLSTFSSEEDNNEVSIECKKCGNISKYKISYEHILNPKNIHPWDKERSFNSYIFNFSLNLNNSTTLTIYSKIPSIYEFLTKISGVTLSTIINNIETDGDILDEISMVTIHTLKLELTGKKNIDIINPNEIFEFYSSLPISIKDAILNKFKNLIYKYKPRLSHTVICDNCETKIHIKSTPMHDFISNIFELKDPIKEITSFSELLEGVSFVEQNPYMSISDMLDLPYPLFVSLSNKYSKTFKKRMELLNNNFKNISSLI